MDSSRHATRGRRVALLLAAGIGLAGVAATPAGDASVHASFERLREALARGDGAGSTALLTERSFAWLERARGLALHAPRAELARLAPDERFVVLALRHRGAALLEPTRSAREALAALASSGGLDPQQVRRARLGAVTREAERASAPLRAGLLPAGLRALFVREAGAWKLDLGGTAASLREPIRIAARLSGTSEDAVILTLLSAASGAAAGPALWEPPGASAKQREGG